MKSIITLCGILLALSCTSEAKAQFLGDIFFEEPSIAAANGESIVLKVAAFTGAEIFGSTELVLTFESDVFEITDVVFSDGISGEYTNGSDGGLSELRLVAANGVSLKRPSGIVSIAEVTGAVSATPGTIVNISPENRNIFLADRREITNSSLGAEIIVSTNPNASLLLSDQTSTDAIVEVVKGEVLYDRARRLAYDGSVVKLAQPNGSYTEVILLVDE